MTTFGEPVHPQAFFVGYNEGDDLTGMRRLVAASAVVNGRLSDQPVRLLDWDVVVVRDAALLPDDVPAHMCVLAFGATSVGQVRSRVAPGSVALRYERTQYSQTVTVPDTLPADVARLVRADLLPWIEAQEVVPVLCRGPVASRGPTVLQSGPVPAVPAPPHPLLATWFESAAPFVVDADGMMIAGDLDRYNGFSGGGRLWVLPFQPEHPERWLAAALLAWSAANSARFPRAANWRHEDRWTVPEERPLIELVARLAQERAEVIARFDKDESAAERMLLEARAGADAGRRALLTAQGDALVSAVSEALTALGFDVQNVDDSVGEGQAKREDLRVSCPDDGSWTNITEVRGYGRGAKTADLGRLGRFAELYRQELGFAPGSRWYIVNQRLNEDAASRPTVLAGADEDIEVFGAVGGLVVDTRDLFDLANDVDVGVVEARQARRRLKDARGRYEFNRQVGESTDNR